MPRWPTRSKQRSRHPRPARPRFFAGSSGAPTGAPQRSARQRKHRYRLPRRPPATKTMWRGRSAHRAPAIGDRHRGAQPRWRQRPSTAARHPLFCEPPRAPDLPRVAPCREPTTWRRALRSPRPQERPRPARSRSGQSRLRGKAVPIPTPLRRRQHQSTAAARANQTISRRPVEALGPLPRRHAAKRDC
jgi:hypothetical protein